MSSFPSINQNRQRNKQTYERLLTQRHLHDFYLALNWLTAVLMSYTWKPNVMAFTR